MESFESLPLALLQHVLSLVDGDYVVDLLPQTPRIPHQLFYSLSQLSARWRERIQELRQRHEASVLAFHIVDGHDEELRDLHNMMLVRGEKLRSLTLRLGRSTEFIRSFEIVKARDNEQRIDDAVVINWDSLFQVCRKLQRLDLSGVPLHSKHLQRILLAASRHCQELQALIMPKREWHRGPVTTEWLPTMHVLYGALEKWYSYPRNHTTGKRGLVQLSVPQRITRSLANGPSIHELADQYLFAVASFCPNLEYFDGWKDTYQQVDTRLLCEELLYCSKPAWLAFCDRCRHLRELNWYVLPFIDDFFDVFAAFRKPNLTKLTLAGGDHVNFNDNAVYGSYYRDGPWSYSAERLNRVFRACGALEQLHVTFQLPPFDDGARQDAITDGFFESVARYCPRLCSLEITEMFDADYYGSIEGITNKGVTAIAHLVDLREIRLKSTGCEGEGIAALVLNAPVGGPPRDIKMVVGEDASDGEYRPYRAGFYEILVETLGILLDHADQLEGRRFRLHLHGHHRGKPNGSLWRGTANVLKDQLLTSCPWLHVTITERHRQVVVTVTSTTTSSFVSETVTTLGAATTQSTDSENNWWSLWSTLTTWLATRWRTRDEVVPKQANQQHL